MKQPPPNTRLLPCPFCGGKAYAEVDNGKPPVRHYPYLIECKCGATAPKRGKDYEEAATAWNTRSNSYASLDKETR